jgi:hypothetical protein
VDPPPGCTDQYSYRLCQILANNGRFFENVEWWQAHGGNCDWMQFRNYMAVANNPDPGDPEPPEWAWLCST